MRPLDKNAVGAGMRNSEGAGQCLAMQTRRWQQQCRALPCALNTSCGSVILKMHMKCRHQGR